MHKQYSHVLCPTQDNTHIQKDTLTHTHLQKFWPFTVQQEQATNGYANGFANKNTQSKLLIRQKA